MTYKLYEALGLQKGASASEIKSAYRKLAVVHHPDKGGDADKFKDISAAYNILGDDEKRQEYDQIGDEGLANNGGGGGGGGFNPHDIFSQMFGNMNMGGGGFGGFGGFHHHHHHHQQQQPRNIKRSDRIHEMHMSLKDSYFGMRKNLKIGIERKCFECLQKCHSCQGRGIINGMVRDGPFTQIIQRQCDRCNGTGNMTSGNKSCSNCAGTGCKMEEKNLQLDIPRGVDSASGGNNTYVAQGLGEQAQTREETSGDLHLRFIVDADPVFRRQGPQLHMDKIPISFVDSVVGKVIDIAHFDGVFQVNTRETFGILQPLKEYTIANKGMPRDTSGKRFGNLIVTFDIQYPEKLLNENEAKILSDAFHIVL